MDAAFVRLIWRRARHRCEYCLMPRDLDDTPFEIDHIVASKHGGGTTAGNLALSCFFCNSHKGSNIAGRDVKTRALVPLFNPRRHAWHRHFRWNDGMLIGRTAIGRVTIAVLNINDAFRIELRQRLMDEGLFPPVDSGRLESRRE
jgi:hypothetical protein